MNQYVTIVKGYYKGLRGKVLLRDGLDGICKIQLGNKAVWFSLEFFV